MTKVNSQTGTALAPWLTPLEAGWLLLAILTPLWVCYGARQPFELPKVVLVRAVVGLLAPVGLIVSLHADARRFPLSSLRFLPIFWPVVALTGILILATTAAVDPALSLWGSYERGQGLLTQLAYLLLFVLVAGRLRTLAQARRLISALVWPATILVVLGSAQAFGWQPLPLLTDGRSPVYATLGRSNFLGAYLALLLPLTLALRHTTSSGAQRMALSALFLGQLAVLGLTLARTAWVTALVGLALFALLGWGSGLDKAWRRTAGAALGLLALSGPLAVGWLGQAEQGSGAARLAIWQATLDLVRQRPFLGYGPDSLLLVFPRVFPPELVYYHGRQVFVDRAHNWLLDWAVTGGLLGLLAFLSVLATVIFVALRALRETKSSEKRLLLAGTLAAVGANLTNNLTSFDVTATATAAWLLMGLAVALAAPGPEMPAGSSRSQPVVSTAPGPGRPLYPRLIAGLIALAVTVAALGPNGRILLADMSARRAELHALAGDWQRAATEAERAIAYWSLEPAYYHQLAGYRWQQAASASQAAQVGLQEAEAALLAARALRPEDVGGWAELAEFYAAAARQFGADTRPLAHGAYRQALALAPRHATVYVAWGGLFLEEGDPEQAALLLREAVRLDSSHGLAYLLLAETELGLGRLDVAIADYREAVRLEPESSMAHTGLAHSYWLSGRQDAARSSLAAALALDPHDARALALAEQMQLAGISNGGEP